MLRLPADENPLGGLAPEQILAAGESQSAACLVTYVNAIDPHARLFDGFFVHGRPGVGVSIDGVFIPSSQREGMEATRRAISHKGERIRQDARVPVLVLQSETDVILLGGRLAAQPDSERIRVWEMAGRRTPTPTRSVRVATTMARSAPSAWPSCCAPPRTS